MKNLQHLRKVCIELSRSVNTIQSGNSITGESRSLSNNRGLSFHSERQTVADRTRNYCLCILIFTIICQPIFGEIKNGYERNISLTKESLKILRSGINEGQNITPAERRRVQSTIETLVNYVSYYDLTERLLEQFRTIAPQLYAEIDTITDRLGRPVNVYVKFVPIDGTNVKAEGTTYMDHSDYDKDLYQSEYGEFTVSVKVWIVPRALLVLAHEFGHIKFQVPNLASYYEFYKKHYNNTSTPNFIGHDTDDPSGQSAVHFAKRFQKIHADFIRLSIERVENPLVVLAKLKKNWTKNTIIL